MSNFNDVPGPSGLGGTISKLFGRNKHSKRLKLETWKKDCTCLRYKDQRKVPSPAERISLQKLGLVKDVTFNNEGDAFHIDDILHKSFPCLTNCGGYALMRQSGNELISIEPPNDVKSLREVLLRARLYIRPLQRNVMVNEPEGQVCVSQ